MTMKTLIPRFLILILASLTVSNATDAQPLRDLRRVVIADHANAGQRAAADEVANYAGSAGRPGAVCWAASVVPFHFPE